ncbi:hypothetical protein CAL7102_04293 [Dulcicalothrix desertica PCC 7102]|nr:hypothetical protein CAL7102_04293 [Dulcicalothrix desertica PCC 7102]
MPAPQDTRQQEKLNSFSLNIKPNIISKLRLRRLKTLY